MLNMLRCLTCGRRRKPAHERYREKHGYCRGGPFFKAPILESMRCPQCGKFEPHFVPPSLGEEGFFICDRQPHDEANCQLAYCAIGGALASPTTQTPTEAGSGLGTSGPSEGSQALPGAGDPSSGSNDPETGTGEAVPDPLPLCQDAVVAEGLEALAPVEDLAALLDNAGTGPGVSAPVPLSDIRGVPDGNDGGVEGGAA